MNAYTTEGIVLKRKNLGEADRLITLFTKKYGKIKILAKGVRKIKSRRGPNMELFNQVEVSVHQGHNLDLLSEAEVINTFSQIRKNLDLVGLAFHVCEVVDSLCPEHQAHPRVYDLMLGVLDELDSGLVHRFEKSLLEELGYLPREHKEIDTTLYIEKILERKLKTRRIINRF
ncbi:MAG TPA: DNA repair protein RecO [Patescibacteria group bacterium]|nr:DNA repair protein RecO [Patescibacteria group bacterium]